jgi:hypothetical protein
MIPDMQRRALGWTQDTQLPRSRPRGRRHAIAPAFEYLEGRQLLSSFTGPSRVRPVHSSAGDFLIQVGGSGLVKVHPAGHGAIDLVAFGTTAETTITVTLVRPRWHFAGQLLPIRTLTVTSGQLGGLDAAPVELVGTMTPLNNTVANLVLGEIGPKARVDIDGSVGDMTASAIDLGPTGHVVVSGALNTADLTGSMQIGGLTIDGGRFVIGQDSLAPISVAGNMTISHNGIFSVGRDLDGSLQVNGNLTLDSGGQLFVGRNLSNLTVTGNLRVNPTGSGIVVDGALGGVTVDGTFQGQGGTAAPTFFDLGVGLNLTGLTILGGNKSLNGLINSNIRAGGTISGVDIAYGTVNSTIQPNTPLPDP